ncbi:phage portal protein [Hyphomonas oceanitis]|uniref:Phage portal protein n=1 Tax=Hyphomonas oceanitis SCH89 TaxID=1280953 RepID=A0A059G8C2_9PROT|nr:phage portal protein [Hyphomonas oceanitis]KDA03066.1 hypothetical protein HOC_07814 [Hyphomonas oceanitis SCH89]
MFEFVKNIFSRREVRSTGSGFTAELMAARESWIAGNRGIAELTGTAQACIGMWENGLALADVSSADLLTPRVLAMSGRSLAIRGEAVFLIREDGLVPCADWDLSTRNGKPVAYRVSISEAGGGTTEVALAGEVLHFRTGVDIAAPWAGQAPLKRASLSAGMLNALETSLSEAYENMPLGSQIISFPESANDDLENLGRGFRARRGRVLLRESVYVSAAGGPTPTQDWKPHSVTPDISGAMPKEMLDASRASVLSVFGVLPAMLDKTAQGPLIREGQRHLAQWMLQPIAKMIAEEMQDKLGESFSIDVMRPLQAFDTGGRARAATAIVQAMAAAKEGGLSDDQIKFALDLVDWGDK